MKRRDFLALAGAAATFPNVALAQAARAPRIAFLRTVSTPPSFMRAFTQGLADFGYADGQNITVEFFTAPTWPELDAFAARAVASQPAIIVTNGSAATQAVRDLTSTIPIVFASLNDPVGTGVVVSRTRPSGNVTGSGLLTADLIGRQLTLIKELLPAVERMVVLGIAGSAPSAVMTDQVAYAAATIDIDPVVIHFVPGRSIAAQFERVAAAGAQAVYVPSNDYFAESSDLLSNLQMEARLPLIGTGVMEDGTPPFTGVAAYGPSVTRAIRASGAFIDAILKGAKPGDLSVTQPTVFDLGLNLRVAKAIGVTIEPSTLKRATMLVEEDGSLR